MPSPPRTRTFLVWLEKNVFNLRGRSLQSAGRGTIRDSPTPGRARSTSRRIGDLRMATLARRSGGVSVRRPLWSPSFLNADRTTRLESYGLPAEKRCSTPVCTFGLAGWQLMGLGTPTGRPRPKTIDVWLLKRTISLARGADVAELADALDSKSSVFTDVWVRPPPSVPKLLLRS